MQENDFEKKLQHTMEHFVMVPADPLWDGIQAKLREEKRRRRKIFWLFFLSLLVVSSVLLKLYTATGPVIVNDQLAQKDKAFADNRNAVTDNAATPGVQKGEQVLLPVDSSDNTATGAAATAKENAPAQKPAYDAASSNNATQTKRKNISTRGRTKYQTYAGDIGQANANAVTQAEITGKKKPVKKSKAVTRTTVTPASVGDDVVAVTADNAVASQDIRPMPLTDSSSVPTASIINKSEENKMPVTAADNKTKTATENIEVAEKKINHSSTAGKWNFFVGLSAGATSFGNQTSEKNLASVSNSDGTGVIPFTGIPGAPLYQPNKVKTGNVFGAAAGVHRKISSSISLSLALRYDLSTASIETGYPTTYTQQSNVYTFYAAGNVTKYRSYVHTLSLPVDFSVKLFEIKKHAVLLGAGGDISRIIASGLLQFNSVQGIYFRNNNLLNKTQYGVHLFADFNLASGNKPALYIGPEYYRRFTSFADVGLYANSYYHYWGLRIRKMLHK